MRLMLKAIFLLTILQFNLFNIANSYPQQIGENLTSLRMLSGLKRSLSFEDLLVHNTIFAQLHSVRLAKTHWDSQNSLSLTKTH